MKLNGLDESGLGWIRSNESGLGSIQIEWIRVGLDTDWMNQGWVGYGLNESGLGSIRIGWIRVGLDTDWMNQDWVRYEFD